MDASIKAESSVFLATMYGGVIMGFIYDLYRVSRYYSRPKKVRTLIGDFIFWIVLSSIALFIMISTNWGELRGFIFLGFIIGAILYNKLLSKVVLKVLVRIINFLISRIKESISFCTTPFSRIMTLIKRRYNKIKKYFKLPLIFYDNIKKNVRTILKKK